MSIIDNLNTVARGTLAQGKRWMLTINNPTFDESEKLYQLGQCTNIIDCLIYGAEHCDHGTPHFQIYLHFKQNWRWNRIKNLFPRADIELAKKPKLACCRYCAKEGFYMAFGNVPDLQSGHRVGSNAQKRAAGNLARELVVKKLRTGEIRFADLTDEQLLDDKLCKGCNRALAITSGPYRPELYVCCFVSPTGWGKSFSVWNTFKNVTTVEFSSAQEWFISPDELVMLFDEFCGQIRCQKMLKYLDKYPISLPIKGGHRPCYWKAIFICSNTPPDMWYTKEDEKTGLRISTIPDDVRQALYRRIGYPMPNPDGETHVYDPAFTDMNSARSEMNTITLKVFNKIFAEHEQLPEEPQHQPDEQVEHAAANYVDIIDDDDDDVI